MDNWHYHCFQPLYFNQWDLCHQTMSCMILIYPLELEDTSGIQQQEPPNLIQLLNLPASNNIGQDHLTTQDFSFYQESDLVAKCWPQLQTPEQVHVWLAKPEQPALAAWKIWTNASQQLYTKLGLPSQLQTPLGPWTINANISHKWTHIMINLTHQHEQIQTNHFHLPTHLQPGTLSIANKNYQITIEKQKTRFWIRNSLHRIPYQPTSRTDYTPPHFWPESSNHSQSWSTIHNSQTTNQWTMMNVLTQPHKNLFLSVAPPSTLKKEKLSWTIPSSTKELWTWYSPRPQKRCLLQPCRRRLQNISSFCLPWAIPST